MKKINLLCLAVLFLSLQTVSAQKSKKEDKQALDTIKIDGLKWRHIGPSLTSGRISDIAVNQNIPVAFFSSNTSTNKWKLWWA